MNTTEILMETIAYYGTDPGRRGVKQKEYEYQDQETMEFVTKSRTVCEYAITNGETKYCAVGRCLTDDAKAWVIDVAGDISELVEAWWKHAWDGGDVEFGYEMDEEEEFYMDDMLDPAYQGHSVEFWNALQSLHDDEKCWQPKDEPGYLTAKGHMEAGLILEKFTHTPDEYQKAYAKLTTHGREQ